MEKTWKARPCPPQNAIENLQQTLNVEYTVAFLLAQRSIHTFDESRAFFRPDLNQLHDPFLMKDMDRAVDRLTLAIHNQENILIYGDYDVDGTTAVTLVYSFLKQLGAHCLYYIPDRYKEGYGFSFTGVDFARDNNCSLIITLDCGVRDGQKIEYARSLNIDVIVCDHHQPAEIPKATAILDPKHALHA